MPAYGVTPAGFVVPPLSVIISGIQQQLWNAIDPQLDLSPQTADGQILAIYGAYYSSAWELLQVCFNQFNREDAEGAALDNLGDIIGVPREGASYTQVECTLTLDPAHAPYAAGSLVAYIDGTPSFTFQNVYTIVAAQITPNMAVLGTSDDSGLVEIEVASTSALTTNQTVTISQVQGTTEANGTAEITVVDSTHFTIQGSTYANAYVSGGVVTFGTNCVALFQSQVIGQTPAVNDGTLTDISTPVTGWSSIDNPGPGSQTQVGENEELDPAYGPRQAEEIAASGSCTAAATAAALIEFAANLEPPVSINASVLENPEWYFQVINGIGIPPFSYAVFVYDPTGTLTPAQIGQIIYNNKPAGISPVGSISVTIVDPNLGVQTVSYSVPTPKPLTIIATVTPRANVVWATLETAIEAALVEAATAKTPANGQPPPGQMTPGGNVYASQIEAVISGVPGVLDVSNLQIQFPPSPSVTTSLVVEANQIAAISASNIDLTEG